VQISSDERVRLLALREATEAALLTAHRVRRHGRFKNEAVNWADLGVVTTEIYVEDDGSTGWRVYIEEASPTAAALCDYIAEKLAKAGFADIEVISEW